MSNNELAKELHKPIITKFAKGFIPNWSKEVFVIKMLLVILMEKKLLECFIENNYKTQIKKV